MKIKMATVLAGVLMFANVAKADYQIFFRTFNNIGAPLSSTNPFFDIDGSTKLTGAAGYVGQIYAGTSVGSLVALGGGFTAFLDGAGAGFINGAVLTAVDAGVATDTAGFYSLKVWNTANGSTFEAASSVAGAHFGETGPIAVTLKGYTPPTTPPTGFPDANLHLAQTLIIPEPTTLALGAMGMAGLFLRRRKQ